MGMSQMCTGAGDYFKTSKPHSEKLCSASTSKIILLRHYAKRELTHRKYYIITSYGILKTSPMDRSQLYSTSTCLYPPATMLSVYTQGLRAGPAGAAPPGGAGARQVSRLLPGNGGTQSVHNNSAPQR